MRNLILFLALTIVNPGTAHAAPTVGQVRSELAKLGPRRVIDQYFDCESGSGYRLVASGHREAIQLGVQLLADSDACVSEMLQSALGEAMTRQPQYVLPYVGTAPYLMPQNICLPFVSSDEPGSTLQEAKRRARRALERVQDPRFTRQKALCMAEITH
jgi:hypothetical protein